MLQRVWRWKIEGFEVIALRRKVAVAGALALLVSASVSLVSGPAEAQRWGRGFGYGGFGPGFAAGALAGAFAFPYYAYRYPYGPYLYGYPYGPYPYAGYAYGPAVYAANCTLQRRPIYSRYHHHRIIGYRRVRVCG